MDMAGHKALIQLGEAKLNVYLATTPTEWKRGLAGLDTRGVDGMLFVMPSNSWLAFHAGGVREPLLVAFFDDHGAIVDAQFLHANAVIRPVRTYRYALELTCPIPVGVDELLAGLVT